MISLTQRGALLRLGFALAMAVWPLVYKNDYALSVMVVAGVFAVMAVGFTILFGQAHQISMGQAAFFGIGAYTSALLTVRLGAPPLLALIAGAVAAGAVAYGVGVPVLRLKGFILALVTLGLGEIFYILARETSWLTGGRAGVAGIPWLQVGGFALDDYPRQYYAIWALALVLLVFSERAMHSRPGRAMRALAVSEATASTLGVRIFDWKLVAFVVSAVYAGLAGGLYAFVISTISPEDFGFTLSTMVIIITMLGGMGNLFGALGGAILLSWLVRSFASYQEYSGGLYALVLILLVIFLPGGMAGVLRPGQFERVRLLLSRGSRWTSARAGCPSAEGEIPGEPPPTPAIRVARPIRVTEPDPPPQAKKDRFVSLPNGEPLLRIEGVSISFGGLQAVSQVSLAVPEGAIASLIGPNGAGKTTLFNAISGLQHLDSGRIWFAGQEITRRPAAEIARLGTARTFQSLHLFGNMTALGNVMVGRHRHERAGFVVAGLGLPWQLREEEDSRTRSLEALSLVGLEDRADWPVTSLSYGQQRLVEIARALATEPRLLLLDEPAAGLNTAERVQLMERVERIRDARVTVLLVEHDMDLVMGISDCVSVLDYGKLIAEGQPEEVQRHPAVIEAYLGVTHRGREDTPRGTSISVADRPSGHAEKKDALLEVDGVSTYYGSICAVRGASLRVCPGEIVAVLGSNGAGKTTLLRTILGILRPRNGRILYEGSEITRLSPPEIVARGIGHVPEGRHVFPTLSVHDNLRLGAYRRRDQNGIRHDFAFVYELFPRLAERRRQMAGTLSGGEQQMLAIGRALMGSPRLLLVDEPSMGLAPQVVEHIFETLVDLNERGLTVLMVEQNAEMALSIAHHAFVLQTGQVALSGPAVQLRRDERVQRLYLGHKQSGPESESDREPSRTLPL